MRRFAMALGVMAAVLLVAGVSAQNMKDFSGKWTADADRNGPAPAGGRGGGASDFTITMDAKTMNIVTVRNGTESKVSYKLDGTVSKNDPPMGARGGSTTPIESVAKWDGDKLVIVTKGANGDTTTKYFFDAKDLVREQTRPGQAGAEPTTTRQYFKKAM
jgi:hypothetical protein